LLSSRIRALLAGSCALGASALVTLPGVTPAGASASPVHSIRPGRALYDVGVRSGVTQAQVDEAAQSSATFPHFKATVKVGTTSYTYVIAGKNPAVKQTNPAATIKAELVPLVMKFANGDTWNPTKIDSCDPAASPLSRVKNSPVVQSLSWTWGGTPIGTGQVTDAYQRADFWKYAQPSGINPSYAVKLTWTTLKPVTITVPSSWGPATGTASCGNGLIGAVNINSLYPYLQSHVIPALASEGVSPATVPVFLLHNFVEYVGTTSACCVLGFHNAYSTPAGIQTYGLAEYDNSGDFPSAPDIAVLTHEVGEWQNDPYTTNPTPPWGHVGQVSGCQSNLEVGDPLSGTTFPVTVGGFTYHPQELAFFSWFYHQSPSLGVNGWYSDQGTFTSYAAPCT
jgi:hypothetical protein